MKVALTAKGFEQNALINNLRVRGIYKTNKEECAKTNPTFERERNQGRPENLVMCSGCQKFIQKRCISRHTSLNCTGTLEQRMGISVSF